MTVDDQATWAAWATTAARAGEPALAQRLLRRLLSTDLSDNDRRWTATMLAAALVQRGQPGKASAVLSEAGLGAPDRAGMAGMSHAVTAAAAAARGDDVAYRWLLGVAVAVDGMPAHATVVELLTAAADSRRDGVADDGWRLMVRRYGARDAYRVARFTAAAILERDRQAAPETLRRLMASASDNLMDVVPDATTHRGPAQEVERRLRERGDGAGALLLQRALSRRLRPLGAPPVLPVTHAPAWYPALAVLAVTALAALAVFAPPAGTAVVAIVLGCARPAWARWVPRPGLTLQESRAWRTVGPGPGGAAARPGVGATASTLGVALVIGLMCAAIALDPAAGHPWFTQRSAVVWLGMPALLAWAARAIMVEAVRRARVAQRRRRPAPPPADDCRCTAVSGYAGATATAYAAGHLVRSDDVRLTHAARSVARRSALLTCPVTGTPWLYGPLGRYGRPLALAGPPVPHPPASQDPPDAPGGDDRAQEPAASSTTGQGFYL